MSGENNFAFPATRTAPGTAPASDFAFPSTGADGRHTVDTAPPALRALHARWCARCRAPGRQQRPTLSASDIARPDVLALFNATYNRVHGLTGGGVFVRAGQVVAHFDEDGDGAVSASEFADRMLVRALDGDGNPLTAPPAARGAAGPPKRNNKNGTPKPRTHSQNFSAARRLAHTRRVVESSRGELVDALAGRDLGVVGRVSVAHVRRALNSVVKCFDHLGHQRLINMRFHELQEVLARVPSSSLVSRSGIAAVMAVREQLEQDAATLIARWHKGGYGGSARSSGGDGGDFWTRTLRQMTERDRLGARARARDELRQRASARQLDEQHSSAKSIQSLFRGRAARKRRLREERAEEERERREAEAEAQRDAEERRRRAAEERAADPFAQHRAAVRQETRLDAAKRKAELEKYLRDPFVTDFLSYREPKQPSLSDFWTGGASGAVASSGSTTLEDPEQPQQEEEEAGRAHQATGEADTAALAGDEEVQAILSGGGSSILMPPTAAPPPAQRPWTSQGMSGAGGGGSSVLLRPQARRPRGVRPMTSAGSRASKLLERKSKRAVMEKAVYNRPQVSAGRLRRRRQVRATSAAPHGRGGGKHPGSVRAAAAVTRRPLTSQHARRRQHRNKQSRNKTLQKKRTPTPVEQARALIRQRQQQLQQENRMAPRELQLYACGDYF